MLPGLILMPVFIATAAFWVFGPTWSWAPFTSVFILLTLITLVASPARIKSETPSAAQSTSSTFSLTMLLAVAIAIGLGIMGRYWEMALCVVILLTSAMLWPSLRTRGGMRMGKHKNVQIEYTVADGLDIAPIKALRVKMQQHLDGLVGTPLENTPYHEKEKETIRGLKIAEEIDFNSIWRAIPKDSPVTEGELKAILFKSTIVMSEDSEHTSLVYQHFNIFVIVTQALQAIRDYLKDKESQGVKGIPNIQKVIDDVESQLLVLK